MTRSMFALASCVLLSRPAFAGEPSTGEAGGYLHAAGGPAFPTFFPIDDSGLAEHLALNGKQYAIGVGRGFSLGPVRLDAGLRASHLHVEIQGSYSADEDGDDYHANYDYLGLLAEAGLSSRWASRVNGYVGLTLGTARLFSDRKGEPLHNHQLPVYGTFEGGVHVRVGDGIQARALLSWVPPASKVSVFAPQVGLRVRL
jgi:hypothetical protein